MIKDEGAKAFVLIIALLVGFAVVGLLGSLIESDSSKEKLVQMHQQTMQAMENSYKACVEYHKPSECQHIIGKSKDE
jgi:signal transduction histidine kinase